MIKTIIIYLLIKVHYPNNDISTIRYYNEALDKAMKEYCWLNVEYDIVDSSCTYHDVDIYMGTYDFELTFSELGTTTGNYLLNPKVFDKPYIKIRAVCSDYALPYIIQHEIGHLLGLLHSNDEKSLMYPYFDGSNIYLSRHDSLTLITTYSKL